MVSKDTNFREASLHYKLGLNMRQTYSSDNHIRAYNLVIYINPRWMMGKPLMPIHDQ